MEDRGMREPEPCDCQHGWADAQQEVIDRLTAANTKLREALERIATADENGICDCGYSAGCIAREALKEEV